jgi:hypothetical protein
MQVLKTYCPARAYELAVRHVLTKGYWQETEDGKPTIESGPITIVLDHPMTEPRISEISPFKAALHQVYAENLLHGETRTRLNTRTGGGFTSGGTNWFMTIRRSSTTRLRILFRN